MALFKDRLKSLRKEHGLTQEMLGEKIGISRSAIANYEGERRQSVPDPALLKRFAEFFDVSIDYLLGHTNERHPYSADNTISFDEALQTLLNSANVMFNDLPLAELDDDTKRQLTEIAHAYLQYKARQGASQQQGPPKKVAAVAAGGAGAVNEALLFAAAV